MVLYEVILDALCMWFLDNIFNNRRDTGLEIEVVLMTIGSSDIN